MIYILLILNVVITVFAQIALKTGMSQQTQLALNLKTAQNVFLNPFVFGGIFSYGVAMILWLIVLSKLELSKAYPSLALGYVLVVLVSYFFLKEPLTLGKVLGSILICIGVILVFRY